MADSFHLWIGSRSVVALVLLDRCVYRIENKIIILVAINALFISIKLPTETPPPHPLGDGVMHILTCKLLWTTVRKSSRAIVPQLVARRVFSSSRFFASLHASETVDLRIGSSGHISLGYVYVPLSFRTYML